VAKNTVKFTSNKAAVMRQYNLNLEKTLHALGMLQNHLAMQEMDLLIYHAPVSASGYARTGRLRASMGYEVDMRLKHVRVGNTAIYAIFVTMGTRFMMKLPFIQNSINKYQADFRQLVITQMGEGFN